VIVCTLTGTRAFLNRNLSSCSRRVRDLTYKTYVRPQLEYASTVWDPSTRKNVNQLEQVQRHAARYVTGNYNTNSSVTAMLRDLEWPTLEQRRHHSRLIMMYKIFNRLVDIDLPASLTRTNANTRGHSSRILEYSCSCNAYASSFYPRTSRDWNALSADPLLCQSVDSFKNYLCSDLPPHHRLF